MYPIALNTVVVFTEILPLYIVPEVVEGSSPSSVYLIVAEGSSGVMVSVKGVSLNPLSCQKSNFACAAICWANATKIRQDKILHKFVILRMAPMYSFLEKYFLKIKLPKSSPNMTMWWTCTLCFWQSILHKKR
jgi:hypothetical protein